MKSIKIIGFVKDISPQGLYVIVPKIERESYLVQKSTGKKITEEESKNITSSDIESKTELKENTDFWTLNPSMNFRIQPDNEIGKKAFNVGDIVDISITKR